jgi:periplasmic protein TonB
MPSVLEREIERAVDETLSPPAARPHPPAPRPRGPQPAVRFSPMFAESPPTARRGRRILIGVSIAVHVVLFVGVLVMPRRAATLVEPSLPIEIVFTAPVPSIPELARIPEPPKPVPKPKPQPPPKRRDEPPPPVVTAPKPVPPPVVPEIVAPPVAKVEPPRPRPEVHTGLLDEMPSGPAIVASKTSRSTVTASGFDGAAGSATSAARPGRVVEVAFDGTPPASRSPRATGGLVRESGFGEEAAAAPKKSSRGTSSGSLDTDVEILSKPKPVYTDEARSLSIEGDVVLDVVFEASGVLTVLGVAQGLGHGLDEAAIVAAKKISFNPARSNGSPVSHTAKLRVLFRLA